MNANALSNDFAGPNQLAQLTGALTAVERMAGCVERERSFGAVGAVYVNATPIARHRFDRALQQTAAWAASGVEALIAAAQGDRPVQAAAARLADELGHAIDEAVGTLGR